MSNESMYIEASVTVDYDGIETAEDTAAALIEWIRNAPVGEVIHVHVVDQDGKATSVAHKVTS